MVGRIGGRRRCGPPRGRRDTKEAYTIPLICFLQGRQVARLPKIKEAPPMTMSPSMNRVWMRMSVRFTIQAAAQVPGMVQSPMATALAKSASVRASSVQKTTQWPQFTIRAMGAQDAGKPGQGEAKTKRK